MVRLVCMKADFAQICKRVPTTHAQNRLSPTRIRRYSDIPFFPHCAKPIYRRKLFAERSLVGYCARPACENGHVPFIPWYRSSSGGPPPDTANHNLARDLARNLVAVNEYHLDSELN